MNHYETLGVKKDASQEEIRAAWRRLSSEHHPDRGGDTDAMARINAAYKVLGDEQLRIGYDRTGADPRTGPSLEQKANMVLAQALKQAIEQSETDAVVAVRSAMKSLADNAIRSMGNLKRDAEVLARRRTRLRRKSDQPNLVQQLIDQQITSIERALAGTAEQLEVFNLCMSMLDDYEDTQAKPAQPVRTFTSTWPSGFGTWVP